MIAAQTAEKDRTQRVKRAAQEASGKYETPSSLDQQ